MRIGRLMAVTCVFASFVVTGACVDAHPGAPPALEVERASVDDGHVADALATAAVQQLELPGFGERRATFLKGLGFGSEEEMRRAAVDAPMAVYRVPLAALAARDEQADPAAALVDAQLRIYPVLSDGDVVSSVTVSTARPVPRIVSLGRGPLVRELAKARDLARAGAVGAGPAVGAPFVVELVEQGWYVGHHDEHGALWLTALRADPRVPGSVALQSQPATAVLASLGPAARRALDRSAGGG